MSTGNPLEVNIQEKQMLDLTGPLPMRPPPKTNPYQNKEFKDHCDLMMSLAHQLQADSAKYPYDQQLRINKLLSKYEVLYMHMPGLFMAALMGKLHEGQTGKVVRAYCGSKGDPTTIINSMHNYVDSVVEPGLQKVEELKQMQKQVQTLAQDKAQEAGNVTDEVLKMYG